MRMNTVNDSVESDDNRNALESNACTSHSYGAPWSMEVLVSYDPPCYTTEWYVTCSICGDDKQVSGP